MKTYLGPRALAAFVMVSVLGLAFYIAGAETSASTLRGLGVLMLFLGLVPAGGLLLRSLIYRRIV